MMVRPYTYCISFLCGVFLFFVFGVSSAHASIIYLEPGEKNISVGDIITVTVKVRTEGTHVNTAETTLNYSAETLEFIRATQGSTFQLATPGSLTHSGRTIYIGGGLPNPGYKGFEGVLGTVVFRAKAPGTGTVSIASGKTLLNDGFGTDDYSSGFGGTYTITARTIAPVAPITPAPPLETMAFIVNSSTHPNQAKWYDTNLVRIAWTLPEGITGFSFAPLDHDPLTTPNDSIELSASDPRETFFSDVADGVWYFHIKGKTARGFTETVHYRLQIDTVPPEKFDTDVKVNGKQLEIDFETYDTLSGIEYYSIAIDGTFVSNNAIAPFQYDGQLKHGLHTVTVTAFDKAGNGTTSSSTFFIPKNYLQDIFYALIILICINFLILIFVILIYRDRCCKKREKDTGEGK